MIGKTPEKEVQYLNYWIACLSPVRGGLDSGTASFQPVPFRQRKYVLNE